MTTPPTRPLPRLIERLLVANRGEIARRVIRSARVMGIETVAVYAPSDIDAPHVHEADHAVSLRGRGAAQTYLDIDQLLAAARATGADAVHPGYGFLSERAAFAQAVLDAGLVWVGPPPQAIDAMGDKLAAKALMAAAGVPVLASVVGDGPVDIGWPVLVKAAAGGGGKGMHIVTDPAEYSDALASARREAEAAFGDGTVFVEQYLADARHVEIQVLADAHGKVVHCFERDCSIQRRHQKIIEEAPSPAVDDLLREAMGAAAVAAARTVGYQGAGTVEFVVDPDGAFFFLEVNTRLQVEHPVTEAVTGLDLVREQLRIAQGEPLGYDQSDLRIQGHAVEARLYAEDPDAGFLPATGTVRGWRPPTDPKVRVDSGIEVGTVVGVEWDPLLAKIIAHGPTRTEAARRLALALQRTVIRGVATNRDFLVATLRHPQFLAGEATTSFVERFTPELRRVVPPDEVRGAAIAATLVQQVEAQAAAPPPLRGLPPAFRNSVFPPQSTMWRIGDVDLSVEWKHQRDGSFAVTAAGCASQVWLHRCTRQPGSGPELLAGAAQPPRAEGTVELEIDGRRLAAVWQHCGGRWWVQASTRDVALLEVDRFPRPETETSAGALAAPMPGTVLAVHVAAGDTVDEGQLLIIMEAMKMEHRVRAPRTGTVVEVRVAVGDQVAAGDLLVLLTEETQSSGG